MKAVENLGREALVEIVEAVQSWLYLGDRPIDNEIVEVWDPDLEWSCSDVCEALAGYLSKHGLVPEFLGDEPEELKPSCEICGGLPH